MNINHKPSAWPYWFMLAAIKDTPEEEEKNSYDHAMH